MEPKRVLVVVGGGGYTNAAPLFEIASILAERGHSIEFGTLGGRASWTDGKAFISRVHILGPGVCPDVEQRAYEDMSKWSTNLISS
ncbi:hypothetical protein K4F52_006128 [Lecanicillium sp. MT-2017a]|nr:hypothetical protein K4F52_006128 [Lecanicillium sp. MT-2017a]